MADDFKAQDFQEAVRDILKDYRKEYLALGDALVERILAKLKDGTPMIKAVEDAVKEAGFLGANAKAISNVLFLAACAGYGVLPKFVTSASEKAIKDKLMSTPWTGDKMKLSKRLHTLKVRQNVIVAIASAMKQAKTVAQMAMDIYDGYNSGQGVLDQAVLRKDLNKVLQMARRAVDGDEEILDDLRKKARKIQQYTHSMKTKPLEAAYNEFVDACTADELSETAIERAARTAIEETTRYQAERMARTEAARAWFDGYIAAREDDSDVWGYRWRLSSRHYRCPFDQCDVCANMNVGYGKGIYPKNKVPSIPRHPHCMCMLEDVFSWEQDGEEIKPEGAREYIDSLEEKQKEALFGKDGLQAYEAGGDWQKLLRGWDGFRKPKSRLSLDDFKFDLQLFGGKIPDTLLDGSPYNLTIRRQVQNRHISGTKEYEQYVEKLEVDGMKPSILAHGVEPQQFVRQYHKTGVSAPSKRDGRPREIVDAGFIVGQYWDIEEQKYLDTTWAKIVYSKKGTHVYPIYPEGM